MSDEDFVIDGRSRNKGGRPKGAVDKGPRKSRKFAVGNVIPGGKDPLEYMLAVMNDEKADLFRRDKMAVAAAPYVHVKMTSEEESETLRLRRKVGKKEFVARMAASAGEGTEWGDDLKSEVAN